MGGMVDFAFRFGLGLGWWMLRRFRVSARMLVGDVLLEDVGIFGFSGMLQNFRIFFACGGP